MSKRVYGPGKPEMGLGEESMSSSWKLISNLEEDRSVHLVLFVLFVWVCFEGKNSLERWNTVVNWSDIRRAHLRRDKNCLFMSYRWIFGEGRVGLGV